MLASSVEYSLTIKLWIYFWALYSVPLIYVSVLMPYIKINSRWIKDLNISSNTIKVLEENIGRKILDIPCSSILTDMSPKASDIKERMNKWHLVKIKSLCTAKENSIKMKREPSVSENITFANDTSDKGLISKNI